MARKFVLFTNTVKADYFGGVWKERGGENPIFPFNFQLHTHLVFKRKPFQNRLQQTDFKQQSLCHRGSAFVLYFCNAQNTEALASTLDINKGRYK